MSSHKDRFKIYSRLTTPTPDSPHYEQFKARMESLYKGSEEFKRISKKKFDDAVRIILTQSKNGAGQLTDEEIRFFLTEFNSRSFNYGLGSMPASFNIMESFFKYHPSMLFFELLQEEDYLFSFFDFIDFVTSDECSNTIDYITENLEDNVIYSFNILNDIKEITFKTSNNLEYVIGGVSMVKHEDEISLFLVSGEKADLKAKVKEFDIEGTAYGRSYIKPDDQLKKEAVKLLDLDEYWKVFLYLRIALSTKSIESKYIQKDQGDSFQTITDDFGMLQKAIPQNLDLKEYMENIIKELSEYDAIFEVAYKCLYLPEYFDKNEDLIVVEEHPTKLANETNQTSPFKKEKKYNSDYFFKYKDIWTLDKNAQKKDSFLQPDSELTIEKNGYWMKLQPGSIGKDRKGNKIHNKTWVQQTLSWYDSVKSAERQGLEVSINNEFPNEGYIYILRNAAHAVNIFKVGLTTRTVDTRARELSGTPSPDKFLIIHRWRVKDCVLAERLIHDKLAPFQVNPSRGFFEMPIEEAFDVIMPIIESVNKI
jgi:hypothetical protein